MDAQAILDSMMKQSKKSLEKIGESLEMVTLKSVLVGIPAEKAARDAESKMTNVDIAYIQNFGAPEANIPSREFMRPGIADVQSKIVKALRLAGKAAFNGEDPDKYLNQAGLVAQAGIRAKITNGPFLPLAASTVAARMSRGKKSDKPLIDTGQLRNAITYVIREN